MRRFVCALVGTIVTAAAVTGSSQAAAPWTLVEHVVATDLRGAYDVVAADMNRDGRVDLIAVAGAMPDLVWFENPGSAASWPRHVITSGLPGVINVAASDLDGDGIPELAVASGFSTVPAKSTGVLTLFTHGPNVNEPWQGREIDRTPAAHRVRWMNAHGTGATTLINAPLAGVKGVSPDYKDRNMVFAYTGPDWSRQTVTDAEDGVLHGVRTIDWDGKGRESLLTASFLGVHLHRVTGGSWSRTRLVEGKAAPWPQNGAGEVAVVRAKGGRILATIEPFHGNAAPYTDNELVVYSGSGDAWAGRTVIDAGLNYGHALVAVDLDGDGQDELVAGYRGKPNGVNVYRRGADGQWTKWVLESNGMPGSGCTSADFNGDKRPDVACTGGTSLKWYENQPAQ